MHCRHVKDLSQKCRKEGEMKIRWYKLSVFCLLLALFMPTGAEAAGKKTAPKPTVKLKQAVFGHTKIEKDKNGKKKVPKLTVKLKQAVLEHTKMEKDKNGRWIFQARVRNKSRHATIRKIEYVYSIMTIRQKAGVETGEAVQELVPGTVKLVAKNIRPGKRSETVSCEGDASGQAGAMRLKKICLYAGDALCTYNAASGRTTVSWGTEDKKAPVISGWVGKDSMNGSEPRLVCYTDWKDTFDFTKYVTVKDNRDSRVKLRVDTSGINWLKDGIYKVYYRAVDKSGNEAVAWAKVQVYVPSTSEQIADQVIGSVTKKQWSDEKKARALYNYVKHHCSYVDNGSHTNWRKEAVRGLRYESGDCFTYYAMSKLLITRAGIPNLTITRYPSYKGYQHWWNLLYIRKSWYHFDTTPRKRKADFCLLTDAQLQAYSAGSTFRFQVEKYPKRAKKKISPTPVR